MASNISIPTPNQIMSATEPLVLREYEDADTYDVVRFNYELDDSKGKPVQTIEIVFRHRKTGERTGLRFRGVTLNNLFPITPRDDARLTVENTALSKKSRSQRPPRSIEIRSSVCDGFEDVVFWAADVESC